MGGGEIGVQGDGLLVGMGGFPGATGLMIGKAEEDPGAGVLREQALSAFQALNCPLGPSLAKEAFAVQKCARSGWGATDEPKRRGERQKSGSTCGAPVFGGQHWSGW